MAESRDGDTACAVVTGANGGIGIEIVRGFLEASVDVVAVVRIGTGPSRMRRLRNEMGSGSGRLLVEETELADLDSVRSLAERIAHRDRPIRWLVNNAGVMGLPERTETGYGWEYHLGVNHLAHYVLTIRLLPLLEACGGRVVQVSSVGHRRSPYRVDDPHFLHGEYEKWSAYGQSKTANCLFASELAKRAPGGMTSCSVHPGWIMTGLQRYMLPAEMADYGWLDEHGNPRDGFVSPSTGAANVLWACTSTEVERNNGQYVEDRQVAVTHSESESIQDSPFDICGVWPHATDQSAAAALWEHSAHATHLAIP
ncbi:MAG: SDR family NAD(P)-dependent oxidoreductase [bacterium]|nr:SDR family NAD(P)-dependent oxidoreductase [bacterium]